MPTFRGAAALLVACLSSCPIRAANIDRAHQVVVMVYDISLYNSELDRIMNEADTRGIYGGPGSTPTSRSRDKALTHTTMLAQREAVLSATTTKLAVRATDPQLDALLNLAATNATRDQRLVDQAVSSVKASFEEAMWDQLARTARGNAMFPCSKDQRSRC